MKMKLLLIACVFFPTTAIGEPIAQPASLNQTVPSDALGYIRLPNFWGLLAAPKGNALNDALAHPAHQQQINQIKQAVDKNLLQPLEAYSGTAVRWLTTHLTAPVEAMAVLPKGAPSPIPNVIVRTQLGVRDVATFATLMQKLAQEIPQIQMIQAINAAGEGTFSAGPLTLLVKFHAQSGRLDLLLGQGISQAQLTQYANLKVADNPSFQQAEQQIDSSGQGLFLWLNAQQLLPILQTQIPPEALVGLQSVGLLDIKTITAGIGVSNGKGRLQAFINGPPTGLRQFIPGVNNNFSVTSAGQPGGMLSLSLLSIDLLKGIEQIMQAVAPDDYKAYAQTQQQLKQGLGFDVRDLLEAIGPETVIFSDDSGSYLALRLRNAEKFYGILTQLSNAFGLKHETRQVAGVNHHHLRIPGFTPPADAAAANTPDSILLNMLSRSYTHLYWVEDNGYLLLAQVPQMLADHQQSRDRRTLQQWLQDTQKQNTDRALIALSVNMDKMPRQIYYAYLQLLTIAGDFANAPIDLYSLPSATALGLADTGTYGLQLDLGAEQIGFSMTYESSILDVVLDPSLGAVAALGIVAAVAIPAYQDYTIRARVTQGYYFGTPYKLAMTDYFYTHGKLPTDIKELKLEPIYSNAIEQITLADNGAVQIFYAPSDGIYGWSLLLQPEIDNGILRWSCTSDNIPFKHLPADCR